MNKYTKISYALILTLISTNTILATQASPDTPNQNRENKNKNDSMIPEVNKDIIQGRWDELVGKIKMKWGKITDDDLLQIKGSLQKLHGIIQTKYGYDRIQAEKDIKEFLKMNNIDPNECCDVKSMAP